MKWFLLLVFQLTMVVLGGGCYNTGPSIPEWDRTLGDERFSLLEIKKNMGISPVGACVLDGTFLLIDKDINGTRRPVCLSGEPYVRGRHCVWNTDMVAAPFDLSPCIGECFEHPPCEWYNLFLREGKAIGCFEDQYVNKEQLKARWKDSQHIVPYTASTSVQPNLSLNDVQYDVRTRHRTGKATLSSANKSYVFSFARAATFSAFAIKDADNATGKHFYFLLRTYYPARSYLSICDESLKTIYFNPLYRQQFASDQYFLAYEPSISPHILLISKDFHDPVIRLFEIVDNVGQFTITHHAQRLSLDGMARDGINDPRKREGKRK